MKKRPSGRKFGKKLTLKKERVRELSTDELKQVQGATGWCLTNDRIDCDGGNFTTGCVSEGC